MVAACASPGDMLPPALDMTLPEHFVESTADTTIATNETWWRDIGGDTLDPLVREALAANQDLDVAIANVQAARAAATIAGADRWPQLSGGGSAARNQQIFVGLPIPGREVASTRSTTYRLSLDASWELDLWNRLGQRQKSFVAELQATEADLAGARLSVAGQVSKTWLDVTEFERQRDLAARMLEAFTQTEGIAFDRYERGLISSVDVHLTRTSRENAAALLALRQNQVQQTARRLELLLGRYPSGALSGAAALPDAPAPVPAGLPADLVLRRPDLLAAERRVVAAGARVSESRRNLLPSIRLTGSSGTTSNEMGDLLAGDFSVWSIAGSLLQPIFQGGRLRAAVEQSAAQQDIVLANWARSALGAFFEVETALAGERNLAEREKHLHAASDSASRAWRLSEERYRQGVGDLLSVLEAQRRALDAESQAISVRNARLQARVDLHLALGGGFEATASDSADFLASGQADRESSTNE